MGLASISSSHLKNFAWPLASGVVLAATTAALNSSLPGMTEGIVRISAAILGLAAVPILLALASREWLTRYRGDLTPWRNVLGLSSIVVLSSIWVLHWGMWLVLWLKPARYRSVDSMDWVALFLYASLLGFALAFALRGTSRAQVISAALLMLAGVQAEMYI